MILPGFAMKPRTYARTAALLARRCRVVVPDLYGIRGAWIYEEVVERFARTLDRLGLERVSLIGNSFGGGVELGFTARFPGRVVEAVFVDTLAVAREWVLAREALSRPVHLLRLATPQAAAAFFENVLTHPVQLVGAAWWGFTSARSGEIDVVAGAGVSCHVLWANRDSLLDREDGRRFAQQLRATFTVASGTRNYVDHDWMFRHPELFVSHLGGLGLLALGEAPEARRARQG